MAFVEGLSFGDDARVEAEHLRKDLEARTPSHSPRFGVTSLHVHVAL